MRPEHRTRSYEGPTQAAVVARFSADAAEAARSGWVARDQRWDGPRLLVRYEWDDPDPWAPPDEPAPPLPAASGGAEWIAVVGLVIVVALVLWGSVAMWALAFWVGVFGSIAALLGPRKGYTPGGGFAVGAVFGIFGVAYLALKDDVR